MDVLNLV